MANLGSAQTSFGPGRADTMARVGGGGRGMDGMQALMEEILRRKLAGPPKKGPLFDATPGMAGPRTPGPTVSSGPAPERAAPTALDRARDAAQLAQYRAMSEPPPKVVHFIGGQRVDTIDPDSLNGAQRQAYLAQNSSYQPSGDPERAASNAADWERTGRETAVRKRIQNAGYFG